MANLANLNPHSYHIAECHNEGGLQDYFSGDCCRSTFWPVVVRTLTLARILSDRTLWLIGHVHQVFQFYSEGNSAFTRGFFHYLSLICIIGRQEKWSSPVRTANVTMLSSVKTGPMKAKYLRGKFGLELLVWPLEKRCSFHAHQMMQRVA